MGQIKQPEDGSGPDGYANDVILDGNGSPILDGNGLPIRDETGDTSGNVVYSGGNIAKMGQAARPHRTTVLDGLTQALVDDPVYLVDDLSAGSGGLSTPQGPMPVRINPYDKPRIR